MGFYMVYVMISNYASRLNPSLALAGIVSGIFSISALVVRPLAGRSADRFNKRNVCIWSNLLMGLAAFGYAFTDQIPLLLLLRVLHGIAFGLSSTANIALVTEFIPKERMGEGLGCYGISQVIAQVVGPNLGVCITDHSDFRTLFLLTSALAGAAGLLLMLFPYKGKLYRAEKKKKKSLTLEAFIAKEVIAYTLVGGMFSFTNGIISSFLLLLAKERDISNIGIFFSVGALTLFAVRLFIGRVIDQQGLTVIVNLSLIITAISMGIIGLAPALSWLIPASVLKALGQGSGQICLQTECVKRVDTGKVGVAISTFYIGADIGQGLGPVFGGALSDVFGYRFMFLTCGALMMITMLAFHFYQKRSAASAYKA